MNNRGYYWKNGDTCRAYVVFAFRTRLGIAISLQQVELANTASAADVKQVFDRLVNGLQEGGWSAYLSAVEGELYREGHQTFLRTLVISPKQENSDFFANVHDTVLTMLQQDGELVAYDTKPYSLN